MKLSAPAAFVAVLLAVAGPVYGDCVVCYPDASCVAVPTGFSGNCSCEITVRARFTICKPMGVCDPNNPTTCKETPGGGNPRPQIVSKAMTLRAKGLDYVATKQSLLATALWGASESLWKDSGAIKSTALSEGHHTGTFRAPDGGRFSFSVDIAGVETDSLTFTATITNHDTQRVLIFDGELRRNGEQGKAVERHLGRKAGELVWNLEDETDSK